MRRGASRRGAGGRPSSMPSPLFSRRQPPQLMDVNSRYSMYSSYDYPASGAYGNHDLYDSYSTAFDDYGNDYPAGPRISTQMPQRTSFGNRLQSGRGRNNIPMSNQCINDIAQALAKDQMRMGYSRVPQQSSYGLPMPLMSSRRSGTFVPQMDFLDRKIGGFPMLQRASFSKGKPSRRPFKKGAAAVTRTSAANPARKSAKKRSKKKRSNGNRDYKQQQLAKPWVNDTLKAEITKKFEMLDIAKKDDTPDNWKEYQSQKEKCDTMNSALRLEYIGSHPDADVSKILSKPNDKGEKMENATTELNGEAKMDCS